VDHDFLRPESVFYGPLRWLERRIDRLSPRILTSSQNAKQFLQSEFDCSPEKVVTVTDCVDPERFHPRHDHEQAALAQRKALLGIQEGHRVVVYLGLLAQYQGTDALLQAMAHVLQQRTDVHFLIMGFPHIEYYQQMAHQLGVAEHTTFTGKIPYAEARDFLALGDVAVAPKLSATEGSGKILNYMAMSLPTVAFETPVSREYLGEQGIYAVPGDPVSLAQALVHSLSDTAASGRGPALRRLALEEYSWDTAAEEILRAYDAVCDGRRIGL
jgi:glycosyltransferase involved in cell wall biosynthesis